jgi:hypothetical protein
VNFHDHEEFYIKIRSQPFAIMVAAPQCGADEAVVAIEVTAAL